MLETTNYKLKKPELADSPPDITAMNPNWDIVDTELKSHEGQINSLAPHLSDLITDADGAHGLKIESGTFTPTLEGAGVKGSHTYIYQSGYYYKIGKQVTISGRIKINIKDTAMTDFVRIANLPFVAKSQTQGYVPCEIGQYNNFTGLTGKGLTGYINPGTTLIDLLYQESNESISVKSANIANNTDLMFSATYQTN